MSTLAAIFEEKKIHAIIVSDPFNMHYLANFAKGEGFLYLTPNRKIIVTDSRYTKAATDSAYEGFELRETGFGKGSFAVIKELAKEDHATVFGFEDLHLTFAEYTNMVKATGIDQMVPLGTALNDLRIIKTPEEVEKLHKAQSIGDQAFTHILGYLRPGLTELQVAAELESAMKRFGAEGFSFDAIVASGTNSALPHAIPSEKVIEEGDFLTMDFGCLYKGYCSDMTRTVVIGKASPEQKKIYETVLKAQTEALKVIHGGVIGAEVHKVAADVIEEAGYGKYFGHGLGHSVGLYIHEDPRFSPSQTTPILANTIETVEPGIYIPDFGGVRIEDMILVTEDGYRNLTSSPKELIEII